jgi:hypothetical protein
MTPAARQAVQAAYLALCREREPEFIWRAVDANGTNNGEQGVGGGRSPGCLGTPSDPAIAPAFCTATEKRGHAATEIGGLA